MLGRLLGRLLGEWRGRGMVVAVSGPLGAGKTVLCQAVLAELTGGNHFPSPTFPIVWSYPDDVYHVDLYRLADDGEDLQEYFLPPAITLVEWPEKAPWLLPPDHLLVRLMPEPDRLRLTAEATGPNSTSLLSRWAETIGGAP